MGYSFSKVCANTIPVGTYKAQISEIKFKPSSDGINQYNMEVHYVISEGPCAKRTIIDTIYEKAFSFRLKPFLNAIGVDMAKEFETAKELYEYGIRESKGKFVMIEVGVRTYNGNDYNEVRTWAPLPGSTTSTEDVLKEFGTVELSTPEVLPKKPTVADLSGDTPDADMEPVVNITDDDLPF